MLLAKVCSRTPRNRKANDMADNTAVDAPHVIVPAAPVGEAAKGCPGLKIVTWVLTALVGVAAAAALASFIPRGRRRRGTRRLNRPRPWHRVRRVPGQRPTGDTTGEPTVDDHRVS